MYSLYYFRICKLTSIVILLFCFLNPNLSLAVNDIKVEIEIEKQAIKKQKLGFLGKWIKKRLTKKIAKLTADNKEINQYTDASTQGLIIGILSFLCLFAIALNPWLVIAAGVFAIFGDIICLKVLSRTSNNKQAFRKERGRAIAGLVFSLLTGLLPLALLIAVILSF